MPTYQNRLSRTLDTVQTQEERRGIRIIFVTSLVHLETFQDERNTILGLVVHDLGHRDRISRLLKLDGLVIITLQLGYTVVHVHRPEAAPIGGNLGKLPSGAGSGRGD